MTWLSNKNAVPQASALKADRHDPPDHSLLGVFKKKPLIIIDLKQPKDNVNNHIK